ncbi:hypothetical protein Ct61P_15121 [Colletotrichum tofieldiae]|nr:hypothetical protein Ct61P_15121 [Colletotrichum tofieldiae]
MVPPGVVQYHQRADRGICVISHDPDNNLLVVSTLCCRRPHAGAAAVVAPSVALSDISITFSNEAMVDPNIIEGMASHMAGAYDKFLESHRQTLH